MRVRALCDIRFLLNDCLHTRRAPLLRCPHGAGQLSRLDRLAQIAVHARLKNPFAHIVKRIGRHRDNRDVLRILPAAGANGARRGADGRGKARKAGRPLGG